VFQSKNFDIHVQTVPKEAIYEEYNSELVINYIPTFPVGQQ